MHSRIFVTVVAFMVLALSEMGEAQKPSQEKAAKKACLNGDPNKGVEILTDLFVETNNPIYIFNQGRCFEQNNRYEAAIGRFREYLRKIANGPEADRISAEKHIADCQALLDKERADSRPATTLAPPKAITPPPARVERAAPAVSPWGSQTSTNRVDLVQSEPDPATSVAKTETSVFGRWWFWTAVGVVVAGGVTAGLLLTRSGGTSPFCPDCANSSGVNLQ